jgi:cell division protease FtsH
VHAKGKPVADDIDLMAFARRTPGFTGADLANVSTSGAAHGPQRQEAHRRERLDEAIDRGRRRPAEAHPAS